MSLDFAAWVADTLAHDAYVRAIYQDGPVEPQPGCLHCGWRLGRRGFVDGGRWFGRVRLCEICLYQFRHARAVEKLWTSCGKAVEISAAHREAKVSSAEPTMAKTCEKPGCVALAVGRKYCAVHAMKQGGACDRCRGTGYVSRLGQEQRDVCERCAGTGLRDQERRAPRGRRTPDPVDARGLIRGTE